MCSAGFPEFYRPRDLRLDLRLAPIRLRCLHGHALRPCVNFEEFEERLVWCTVLREPIQRYISQYLYNYEVMGERFDVLHFIRHRPDKPNRQVRMLAGADDLHSAICHVRRMACVGLTERLNVNSRRCASVSASMAWISAGVVPGTLLASAARCWIADSPGRVRTPSGRSRRVQQARPPALRVRPQ